MVMQCNPGDENIKWAGSEGTESNSVSNVNIEG